MAMSFRSSNHRAARLVTPINKQGHIVGRYIDVDDPNYTVRSYFLSNGVFEEIHHADSLGTYVSGINDKDEIVGNFIHRTTLRRHGFIWQNGEFTIIDDPETTYDTALFDINKKGDIVGNSDVG